LANNAYKLLAVISLLALVSCNNRANTAWEYMPDMMDSPAQKAQETVMDTPPEGTRPIGYAPYPYSAEQGDVAGSTLKNPLPLNMPVLERGKKMFDTYCSVCHGPMGKGNGSIVPRFPMPPSLHSDKVRNWSDGRIYHVITTGQNLMPSYASQITSIDRWAIISYVRAMQRAVNPSDADVEALKEAVKNKSYP